ncbi:hypothetical protein ACQUQP_15635 [Marinobacterium sp. YM272]|uniref:hypothetical protein n=1 Tax=Marinobacterium sp. YM272 TaxID=3421654 RepID=UPI003D7F5A81
MKRLRLSLLLMLLVLLKPFDAVLAEQLCPQAVSEAVVQCDRAAVARSLACVAGCCQAGCHFQVSLIPAVLSEGPGGDSSWWGEDPGAATLAGYLSHPLHPPAI